MGLVGSGSALKADSPAAKTSRPAAKNCFGIAPP